MLCYSTGRRYYDDDEDDDIYAKRESRNGGAASGDRGAIGQSSRSDSDPMEATRYSRAEAQHDFLEMRNLQQFSPACSRPVQLLRLRSDGGYQVLACSMQRSCVLISLDARQLVGDLEPRQSC